MNTTSPWSRFLLIAGYIAMLIGAIDPMEGSLLILPGSGLVVLGSYFGEAGRSIFIYRLRVFFLVLVGVGILWASSVAGGIGGDTGYSMWWGLLFLPYPIGWSMSIWGADSPRWVLWSGIVVGIWYLVMMVLISLRISANVEDSAEKLIFAGCIGLIGIVTIGGCIYRLRTS